MSIASSIGTPAAIRAEKVREKRASATFCTMSPIFIGNFSFSRSHCMRPRSEFFHLRKTQTIRKMPPKMHVEAPRDEVRQHHRELRDGGQLAAEVVEDLLEHRHEERDEREHDDAARSCR